MSLDWIAARSAKTLDPRQVERTLRQLAEQWPGDVPELRKVVEEFPLGVDALLHLISVSSICATRLALDPQLLLWLAHPDVCTERRSRRRMLRDLVVPNDTSTRVAEFSRTAFVERTRDGAHFSARNRRGRRTGGNHLGAFQRWPKSASRKSWNIGRRNCASDSAHRPRSLPCSDSANSAAANSITARTSTSFFSTAKTRRSRPA